MSRPTDATPYCIAIDRKRFQLATSKGSIVIDRSQLEDLREDIESTLENTQHQDPLIVYCCINDADTAELRFDGDGDLRLTTTRSHSVYLNKQAASNIIAWLTEYVEEPE